MRQIPLKILRARLTKELANLPFEITKNGKVVGVVSGKGLNLKTNKGLNPSRQTEKKFKPIKTIKSTWVNPLTNTVLAPKKGKE